MHEPCFSLLNWVFAALEGAPVSVLSLSGVSSEVVISSSSINRALNVRGSTSTIGHVPNNSDEERYQSTWEFSFPFKRFQFCHFWLTVVGFDCHSWQNIENAKLSERRTAVLWICIIIYNLGHAKYNRPKNKGSDIMGYYCELIYKIHCYFEWVKPIPCLELVGRGGEGVLAVLSASSNIFPFSIIGLNSTRGRDLVFFDHFKLNSSFCFGFVGLVDCLAVWITTSGLSRTMTFEPVSSSS